MANPYPPNYGPAPDGARYPALDGLRALPAGAARPNPYGGSSLASQRLIEAPGPTPVTSLLRVRRQPGPVAGLMTALPGPKLEQ